MMPSYDDYICKNLYCGHKFEAWINSPRCPNCQSIAVEKLPKTKGDLPYDAPEQKMIAKVPEPTIEIVAEGVAPFQKVEIAITENAVEHPQHYQATLEDGTKVECMQVMEALGMDKDHCVASAFAYLWRANLKVDGARYLQDLEKAAQFLRMRIIKLHRRET